MITATLAPSSKGVIFRADQNFAAIVARSEAQQILLAEGTPGTFRVNGSGPIPAGSTALQCQEILRQTVAAWAYDGADTGVPSGPATVFDNTDPAWAYTSDGSAVSGYDAWLNGNLETLTTGTATLTAPLTPGRYRVAFSWYSTPSFSSAVTVAIRAGDGSLIHSEVIDQSRAPARGANGFQIGNAIFQDLGQFPLPATTRITVHGADGKQVTVDAVSFTPYFGNAAVAVSGVAGNLRLDWIDRLGFQALPLVAVDAGGLGAPTAVVIPALAPGYSESPGWTDPGNAGFAGTARFGGAGLTATWVITGLPAGRYGVAADYDQNVNTGATRQPYAVFDGSNPLGEVEVNHQVAPSGSLVNGHTFQPIGEYTIASGTLRVQTGSDRGSGYALVDALRISVPAGSTGSLAGFTKFQVFRLQAGDGNHPTLHLPTGDVPLTLADWGASGAYLPTIQYLAPFVDALAARQASVSAPAGWCQLADGTPAPAWDHVPLLLPRGAGPAIAGQTIGGSLLPAFDRTRPLTMRVGYNIGVPNPVLPVRCLADRTAAADPWSATIAGGAITLDARNLPATITGSGANAPLCYPQFTDPLGRYYRNGEPGVYTLDYTSTNAAEFPEVTLNGDLCALLTDLPHATVPGRRLRRYQVVAYSDARAPAIGLAITVANPHGDGSVYATGLTAIHLWPPGVDPDNPPFVDPQFRRQLESIGCARFLDWSGANGSMISAIEEVSGPADRFGVLIRTTPRLATVKVEPWTDDGFFATDPGTALMLITLAAPRALPIHGNNEITWVNDAPVHFADGTTREAGKGFYGKILPLSPTQFVMPALHSGGEFRATAPVAGPQALTGTLSYGTNNPTLVQPSIQAMVAFCNDLGCDLWYPMPITAGDAFVVAVVTYIRDNLRSGLSLYLEPANEIWNYYLFLTNAILCAISRRGLGDAANNWPRQTARTGGRIHAIAAAIYRAAGKTVGPRGDLVRVFSTQGGAAGVTAQIAQAAAGDGSWLAGQIAALGLNLPANYATGGVPIDFMATAPYWSPDMAPQAGGGEPRTAAVQARMNSDQVLDRYERMTADGQWGRMVSDHRGPLDAAGYPPSRTRLGCYEAGPDHNYPEFGSLDPATVLATTRHPREFAINQAMLDQMQTGGADLLNIYTSDGTANVGNAWGTFFSYSQLPGVGDGSDGKFDNRTAILDTNSVVCPVAAAIQAWNAQANPVIDPNTARALVALLTRLRRSA